ncbi:hypothetical protein Dimus_002687 [Dionaea muscipula]
MAIFISVVNLNRCLLYLLCFDQAKSEEAASQRHSHQAKSEEAASQQRSEQATDLGFRDPPHLVIEGFFDVISGDWSLGRLR